MFVGFSVNNYKSFDESQSISLVATKVARHKDHVITTQNKKILKSGLIFGANAGGKSNLIKAVYFSRKIILNGMENVDVNKKYFRINKEGYLSPGIFEYRLITDKGYEYSYGIVISYSQKEIISEWLIRIEKNGSETYIFNREVDENNLSKAETEIKFKDTKEKMRMKIYLDDFDKNISESFRKKTILSDIAQRGNEKGEIFSEIEDIYKWFCNILILFPTSKYNALNEVSQNEYIRRFFSSIMNYFDTGIQSVESQVGQMDFDKIFEDVPKAEAEKIKTRLSNSIKSEPVMVRINQQIYSLQKDEFENIVTVKMVQNHGNKNDLFEYADESDGTKRLFDLIPLFYENKGNRVIFIDEIDRSFHTKLTKRYLELFYELTQNNTCQIIATTHDSNLLDLDLVRQDEIWFVERQDNQSSCIFSLNKFKERYDKRIDKEYLSGRYGAIPVFDNELLEDI